MSACLKGGWPDPLLQAANPIERLRMHLERDCKANKRNLSGEGHVLVWQFI